MHDLLNKLLFRVGASGYDLLTRQSHWQRQIRRLLDHVPVGGPLRVLDLGCGPGISAFELAAALPPGSTVTGVDLSPAMIDRARRHHRERHAHLGQVSFVEADATRLPFADGAFDLITGHSFLYLVPDRPAVLREARRVLADEGRLVFMEPSRDGSIAEAMLAGLVGVGDFVAAPFATGRFALSMVLWRGASAAAGRMTPDLLGDLFRGAGFAELDCQPTLGGLGLHAIARGRLPG